ncbi:LysR family transcriptional regulator [Streptomyces sp. NPDC048331]|uniref:LysR family transcriptional regulator n=1 Tax=Streptomyces sp. NPDC048331 TaxID=3365534 RepID=UPI00371744F0
MRPEVLPPTALQAFVTVTAHGSFTAAAADSGYTQSAISRQITTLEDLCGVKLFVRGARGVRLTTAGEMLLPHARSVLDELAAAGRALNAARRFETGSLRVGAFPTANATLIPQALTRFRAAYPKIPVDLCEGTSERLLPMLESGEIDIAVLSSHKRRLPEPVVRHHAARLLDDPLMVALPSCHRLAERPQAAWAELADSDWIVGDTPEALDALRALCESAGFAPRSTLRVSEWIAKLRLVAAGLGITLVPGLALDAVPDGVTVLPLAPAPPVRQVYAVLSEQARSAPAARALLAELRAAGQARSSASARGASAHAGPPIHGLPVRGSA